MTVQVFVCDVCGRASSECDCMIAFHKFGFTLRVCDKCIDAAKELVDKIRNKTVTNKEGYFGEGREMP